MIPFHPPGERPASANEVYLLHQAGLFRVAGLFIADAGHASNGRYRRHSGHWSMLALNASAANDPERTCNVVRATFNYAGYVERLRFHLLDQALRNGWDFERPGPVFGGMSEGQARRMVA